MGILILLSFKNYFVAGTFITSPWSFTIISYHFCGYFGCSGKTHWPFLYGLSSNDEIMEKTKPIPIS